MKKEKQCSYVIYEAQSEPEVFKGYPFISDKEYEDMDRNQVMEDFPCYAYEYEYEYDECKPSYTILEVDPDEIKHLSRLD